MPSYDKSSYDLRPIECGLWPDELKRRQGIYQIFVFSCLFGDTKTDISPLNIESRSKLLSTLEGIH